jgi:hypothetical protein
MLVGLHMIEIHPIFFIDAIDAIEHKFGRLHNRRTVVSELKKTRRAVVASNDPYKLFDGVLQHKIKNVCA